MNREQLKNWLRHDEGFETMPFVCSAGKLTIGYGRNLQDNGISKDEAELMLENDMKRTEKDLLSCQFYLDAPPAVKDALFNMCFNLGLPRLLGFKKMIQAIKDKDYTKAALEALDSKWAVQVKGRAKDVAVMMRIGDGIKS
jgi:lysozyme